MPIVSSPTARRLAPAGSAARAPRPSRCACGTRRASSRRSARSSPRASIGFSRLAASTAPSAAPAPTMVCSSSMNRTTWPSAAAISPSTAFSRSSNSPRYFEPASSEPTSSAHTRRPFSVSGTSPDDDALGEALDDGRLADAGVADQHRVVLRAAAKHLDDAADLVVAADHGVELAGLGARGEVDGELGERAVALLGVLVGDALAAAQVAQRLEQLVLGGALRAQQLAGAAALLGEAEQQVLGGDVLVGERLRLRLGAVEHGAEAEAAAAACDEPAPVARGSFAEVLLGGAAQRRRRRRRGRAAACRRRSRTPAEQGEQQVDRRSARGLPAARARSAAACDGFLGLDGETVEVHGDSRSGSFGRELVRLAAA